MNDLQEGQNEYWSSNFQNLRQSQQVISAKVFEDCEFIDCNFVGTTFNHCEFINCRFSKCDLSVVKPDFSQFRDVRFAECKTIGIDWTKAEWPKIAAFPQLQFSKCLLNDSSFFALSLKEITIEGCTVHNADFGEGNFTGANFTESDFLNSLFERTNLTGADFTGAINYSIDISSNTITKATFSRQAALGLLDSLNIKIVD
jgi:fluoroquinolone resistance protein